MSISACRHYIGSFFFMALFIELHVVVAGGLHYGRYSSLTHLGHRVCLFLGMRNLRFPAVQASSCSKLRPIRYPVSNLLQKHHSRSHISTFTITKFVRYDKTADDPSPSSDMVSPPPSTTKHNAPDPNHAYSRTRRFTASQSSQLRYGSHMVYIGLGSNLGDRFGMIESACREMDAQGIRITRTSSLYETSPMYVEDQAPFINGVCEVSLILCL